MHARPVGETTVKLIAEPVKVKEGHIYQLGTTPLKINKIVECIKSSYKSRDREELISGLSNGFSLHYAGPRLPRDSPNLKSAKQFPEVLKAKILKELEADRVACPFLERHFPTLVISPIGLVPKNGQ